ncbi:MAG TPA: PQQ-dependent dehydrogenase, methanol/ethanol family [Candidatus Acidoferrum sp.]|nr:PQQ-dependent dehydrogenase, methanol/ethanol family [Candidatus Acidoferrum sp.]
MIRNLLCTCSILALALLTACKPAGQPDGTAVSAPASAGSGTANVTTERLLKADSEPGQWMTVGGTYEELHYSRLNQITRDNVGKLGLEWFADYDTNLSQQGTPLYVDGVIYVSTARTKVYAFDAKTGKQLWQYDPKTPGQWMVKVCCGVVNRGIAAYEGKIYLGTLDGYLVALDARTGQEVWKKLTIDQAKPYSITSAPRIIKGMVVIGNSGGEFGVRGYIGAYDANTGEQKWRFYTVPGNPADGFENKAMEMAAKTWGGKWWELGGGGAVWDAIVYDTEHNLVIFGTGNGSPWNQRLRDPTGGDNLFLASIVAIDADTGEYKWHYQATPGDTWDYDAMSPMMLVDLQHDGQKRRVVMQPNKNGMFYVVDAGTGELLKADPFTTVNWNDGVDIKTGRPRIKPEARYDNERAFNLAPGVQGAHGWHANAYDPDTGLVYIATQRAYFVMQGQNNFVPNPVGANLGIDMGASVTYGREHPEAPRDFVGFVQAWDPISGKTVWKSEEHPNPTGAVLATAGGLVFNGGGNTDTEFRAYDAKTGEKLWSMNPYTGVVAAPISYELDGKQYVAVSVGIQATSYFAPNYSRLLVFSLDGKAQLPEPVSYTPPPLNPPEVTVNATEVAKGAQHYNQYCAICHGQNGQSRGAVFPNLTVTPLLHSQEAFDQVVLGGVRAEKGMVSFASSLQPADTSALRAYLISRAVELKKAQPPTSTPARQADVHADLGGGSKK